MAAIIRGTMATELTENEMRIEFPTYYWNPQLGKSKTESIESMMISAEAILQAEYDRIETLAIERGLIDAPQI